MKNYFTKMLCFVAILFAYSASINAQCNYTFNWTDSYGDGWNGASVTFTINGVTALTVTAPSGGSGSETLVVNNGDAIVATFASGSYDFEIGYSLLNATGVEILTTNTTVGEVFSGTGACPSCSQPAATFTVVEDCAAGFSVDINVTDLGDATSYDIQNSGASEGTISATGITSVGPFLNGTAIDLVLVHNVDTDCNLSQSGLVNPTTCPTSASVICGTPTNTTHCYSANDDNTFLFTSSDGTSSLQWTFNSGGIESCCDDITIYDGNDASGTVLFTGNNGGDLAGITVNSTGTALFMTISADGSVQCSSGSACCTTVWDWDVICLSCTPPTATFTVVEDCAAGFSVDINVTDLGNAASYDIQNNGVSEGTISGTGVTSVGPFPNEMAIDLVLVHDSDPTCNVTGGGLINPTTCPTSASVTCGTPTNATHCYSANDGNTFLFTSSDGTSNLQWIFNSGGIESCCDNITIYDGSDATGAVLFTGNNGGDLTGVTVNSTGTALFMSIAADGSVQCSSGSACCTTVWDWNVSCLTCSPATATFTVVEDCAAGFSIDIDVTDMGDATSFDVQSSGVSVGTINGVGVTNVGPFTNDTAVDLVLVHDSNSDCDLTETGLVNPVICPPSNDDACSATTIDCGNIYTGNTSAATLDDPEGSANCGVAVVAANVWFKFVGDGQDLTLDLCGSSYDTRISVYCTDAGSCAGFTCIGGNDDFDCDGSGSTADDGYVSKITVPTITGKDFYVMIHGFNAGSVGLFTMDVSCGTACTLASNSDCDATGLCVSGGSAEALTVGGVGVCTTTTGDNSCSTPGPAPTCDPFGVIQDVWYSFVAPASGAVEITLAVGSAGTINYAVYDACGGTQVDCDDDNSVGTNSIPGLTGGATYYIQTWSSTALSGTFDICLSEPCGANAAMPSNGNTNLTQTMSCDNGDGFSYYEDPNNAGSYLFAINWDPGSAGGGFNSTAKSLATIDVTGSAAIESRENAPTEALYAMGDYWNVNLNGATLDGPVDIKFYYNATNKADATAAATAFATANGVADNGFKWFKIEGANYSPADAVSGGISGAIELTGVESTENGVDVVTFTGITSFSGGTGAAAAGSQVLPIQLTSFTGYAADAINVLEFEVAAQENAAMFYIERSKNGIINFEAIAETAAAGTTDELMSYRMIDEAPLTMGYYRMVSKDFDGQMQISNVIAIERHTDKLAVANVYPVPTNNSVFVDFDNTQDGDVQIVITDIAGRQVLTTQVTAIRGNNKAEVNLANLSAGTYFMSLSNGESTVVERIIKN